MNKYDIQSHKYVFLSDLEDKLDGYDAINEYFGDDADWLLPESVFDADAYEALELSDNDRELLKYLDKEGIEIFIGE